MKRRSWLRQSAHRTGGGFHQETRRRLLDEADATDADHNPSELTVHPLGTMKEPSRLDAQKSLITTLWLLRQKTSDLVDVPTPGGVESAIQLSSGASALYHEACHNGEFDPDDHLFRCLASLRVAEAMLSMKQALGAHRAAMCWKEWEKETKASEALKAIVYAAKHDAHRALAWAVTTFPQAVEHEDQ